MKTSETFEKKCGKFIFGQKGISTIKISEEIITSIIKTENESSESNNINKENTEVKKEETISILSEKQNSDIFDKIKENIEKKQGMEESILISTTLLTPNNDIRENFNKLGLSIFNNFKIISNSNEFFETKKNMVILKALIYLNKDDTIFNYENFKKRTPDLNK